MNRTISILLAALSIVLIIVLGFVFFLLIRDTLGQDDQVAIAPTEASDLVLPPTPTLLPPPVVDVLPTNTALPTNTPIPPSPTLSPTDTPLPTATNTAVPPVVVQPTNPPPPPPPTNTPEPTQPQGARGLVASYFGLQDRSKFGVNQQIWFEFTIVNTAGGDVPYSRLGVLPKKDGVDRFDWFQQSYGGPNAAIRPEGLSHEDNIKLPEAGGYTVRLAICFDGYDACTSGGGTWVTMSQEIPVTIN